MQPPAYAPPTTGTRRPLLPLGTRRAEAGTSSSIEEATAEKGEAHQLQKLHRVADSRPSTTNRSRSHRTSARVAFQSAQPSGRMLAEMQVCTLGGKAFLLRHLC